MHRRRAGVVGTSTGLGKADTLRNEEVARGGVGARGEDPGGPCRRRRKGSRRRKKGGKDTG
jgi:hypothetical protein